jgi:hypothetical protein
MNQGKFVFSQLMSLLSQTSFQTCVNRYDGNYKTKHFTCWNQFLCMAFGQLTHRESLTDTMICLKAHADKLYHLGIGSAVPKSTVSKANENRDWHIYQDYGMLLIEEAKSLYFGDNNLDLNLSNNVFAIDATVIDLCLSAFIWASFRTTKGAVKVHTQLDLKTSIPEFIHITTGKIHEVNVLDLISFQADSFYVMDRGYTDFKRLHQIHKAKAFFVIRAKDNLNFSRKYSHPCDKTKNIRCDQTIVLNGFYVKQDYPEHFRRIKYYDSENDRILIFLTNNFNLKATEIAQLYKHRWKIESFFKWIKQHLKIKSFWGQSENAVKTQIWIAIITYVLVAIAKKKFRLEQSLYEILQILSIGIFDKTPIPQLFSNSSLQDFKELNRNQLNIFD